MLGDAVDMGNRFQLFYTENIHIEPQGNGYEAQRTIAFLPIKI